MKIIRDLSIESLVAGQSAVTTYCCKNNFAKEIILFGAFVFLVGLIIFFTGVVLAIYAADKMSNYE